MTEQATSNNHSPEGITPECATGSTPANISLLHYLAGVKDSRVIGRCSHLLLDLLTIAVCAVISGADSWEDVAQYGRDKELWLRTFLSLPYGIPSHDTFNRVFRILRPDSLQSCLVDWLGVVSQQLGLKHLAIDGKTLRHSFDNSTAKSALHLVSAWATQNSLTLGQVAVDCKSNEISAIPKLLQILDLHGAIVTIDAMGCQKEIAKEVIEGGGDYIFTVKGNQPHLEEDVQASFAAHDAQPNPQTSSEHSSEDKPAHGRKEQRICTVIHDLNKIRNVKLWPGLKQLIRVKRIVEEGGKVTIEERYFIGSFEGSAQECLKYIRDHWLIENSLHNVLDVTFHEDASRMRKDHGPENLAMLRRIAVSLLKQNKTSKRSIHGKRLHAAWNDEFLLSVLLGNIATK